MYSTTNSAEFIKKAKNKITIHEVFIIQQDYDDYLPLLSSFRKLKIIQLIYFLLSLKGHSVTSNVYYYHSLIRAFHISVSQ